MFQNKYSDVYFKIIDQAKTGGRSKGQSYFERHHILPKSMGGSDSSENLVLLTAKEHYICHLLLTKMTDGQDRMKMLYAFNTMATRASSNQKRFHSNSYQRFKHHFSEMMSEKFSGENNNFFEKRHTQDTRDHLSQIRKGRRTTRPGYTHSRETREKLRQASTGRTFSDESKLKLSKTTKGVTKGNKPWSVTTPEGSVVQTDNLKEFCKDQGLNHSSVKDSIFRKKAYKGFSFTRLDL